MATLIRHRVLWRLIRVCTVCKLPFYGSPDYSGLQNKQQNYRLLQCTCNELPPLRRHWHKSCKRSQQVPPMISYFHIQSKHLSNPWPFNPCHAELIKMPHFLFPANQITWSGLWIQIHIFNDNSADPDQLASSEANWSGSTLFAKIGHAVFSMRRIKIRN